MQQNVPMNEAMTMVHQFRPMATKLAPRLKVVGEKAMEN